MFSMKRLQCNGYTCGYILGLSNLCYEFSRDREKSSVAKRGERAEKLFIWTGVLV